MAETFDALVIGAGPGGSTAALMLARAGWSVGVIEKSAFPRRKVCGEYVSPTNLPLFRRLGIAGDFLKMAGPPVTQVGLFARGSMLIANMPGLGEGAEDWGRAMGREHLDTLLLERAVAAGASVLQPWAATQLDNRCDSLVCTVASKETGETRELRARVVIAAHGSWETGRLPTQPVRPRVRPSDLLGFKAHFRSHRLASGLMPLFVFPGGYGGMVHTNAGRVSFSCCIRRDELERCRREAVTGSAGDAVLRHIQRSCRGVREALQSARLESVWLSAGPIRPGIRRPFADGVFSVGNAAGEAHPIIAEGISMTMQASWLLCERLTAFRPQDLSDDPLERIGRDYTAAWRRSFGPRIRAAALFANLAIRPTVVTVMLPIFRVFPTILTLGARLSGKATELVTAVEPLQSAHAID
jgi:flavin-dependent dehydrogenase